MPRVRRSSTSRSIGNHASANEDDDEDDDAHTANGSAYTNGDENQRRKSEANEHIAKYVTDQLERIQTSGSVFDEDEYEAQLE